MGPLNSSLCQAEFPFNFVEHATQFSARVPICVGGSTAADPSSTQQFYLMMVNTFLDFKTTAPKFVALRNKGFYFWPPLNYSPSMFGVMRTRPANKLRVADRAYGATPGGVGFVFKPRWRRLKANDFQSQFRFQRFENKRRTSCAHIQPRAAMAATGNNLTPTGGRSRW